MREFRSHAVLWGVPGAQGVRFLFGRSPLNVLCPFRPFGVGESRASPRAGAREREGSQRGTLECLRAGLRPGRGKEKRGFPEAGSARAGIRAGPEKGLGRPRYVRGPVPAPSPALLFLGSLPKAQTFSQTERAGRSRGPERKWGAR